MPGSDKHTEEALTRTVPSFGGIEPDRILSEDDLFVTIKDKYPVSPGHSLIIAKRAVPRFNDLSAEERSRLMSWIDWCVAHLRKNLNPPPDAFNVGFNDGPAAGQTVSQFHVHVIPRYEGDTPDPRGGIRCLIPQKAKYWS
jgi:diadenosine tetraphosphate (Ap4A) HIT family hydrolase